MDATTAALIEEICGNNSECAYDIAVTGNVDVGRETLDDIEKHMMILNQDLPIKLMNNSTAVHCHILYITFQLFVILHVKMMLHVWPMTHVIVTLDTMEHYLKVCFTCLVVKQCKIC